MILILPSGPITAAHKHMQERLEEFFDVIYEPLLEWEEVIMDTDEMLRGIEQATGITYNFSEKPKFMLNLHDGYLDLEPQQVVEYLGTCIAECARRAKELAELRDALEEDMSFKGGP